MKSIIIIAVLAVVGAAGAAVYLKVSRNGAATAQQNPPVEVCADLLPGVDLNAPDVVKCVKHGIPEAICAFCNPELVEKLGWCRGHKVHEAYCTRCSPVLIAAFKVEGDWCEEHNLPESQCRICQSRKGD